MKIDGTTSVLVHLAYPSAHLQTPQLFNPRCAKRGLNAVLVPWQVAPEHLGSMMEALRGAESVAGAIVTLPHKETCAALCDRLEGVASILSVANVIRREADGTLVGRILDGEGFVGGLRRNGAEPAGASVLLIGAGGVALAIAAALIAAGVSRLAVLNRTRARAEAMIQRLKQLAAETGQELMLSVADAPDATGHDLVVNATSLGMHAGDALPVDPDTLRPGMTVAEVVMSPAITPLLVQAAERGAATVPGREMILGQLDPFMDFVLEGRGATQTHGKR